MEVDLQQLRRKVEQELQKLEQRKSVLREQLKHIESVERMASGSLSLGESEDLGVRLARSQSENTAQSAESKSWFRR